MEGPAHRDVDEGQGGDEEGEAEVAHGRRGGACEVVIRALLVLGSLLRVFFLSFQNVYFPLCGLFLFLPFYLVGALTALNCCRPSGRAGRQELKK